MKFRRLLRLNPSCLVVLVVLLSLSIPVMAQGDSGPSPIGDMGIRSVEVHEFASYANALVTSLMFSPDSLSLACGLDDGRVQVLSVIDGTVLRELASHDEAVTSVSFSPDGRWLASSGRDGWVHVTDLLDETDSFALLHQGVVHEVEFSPQGTYLGTVGESRMIRLWDVDTWDELDSIEGHTDTVFALAFSPAEDWIVTGAGGSDPSIRAWNLATGAELQNDLYEGTVSDIEYSPRSSDRHVSIAGSQRMIRLWEVDRGSMLHNVGRFQGAVSDVAYSSAGNTLVAVSEDHTLMFTTMPAWTEKRRFTFDEPLEAVAFSALRQYIACSDGAGYVYLLYTP
ncbi:WD40 repeat domain-containing protein [Candidatus Bipolaricaulota bacterium]